MSELKLENQPSFNVSPIGYVSTDPAGYRIEILEPYRAALKELRRFSHVMIFWWAHREDSPFRRAILTTDLPYAPGVSAGVFACRSPYRPNPIALTTMFMLDVDEHLGRIDLPWIDAEDGTPVLDLKPYIPISDRIRDVYVAEWMADWPAWMEDAGEFFAKHEIDLGG